ncbi:MAG: ADP-ribosylation factor-like protein [Promethearchaeota archaeon]
MLSEFLRMIKGFLLVIGPTKAGKTSILRRLVTGEFTDQEPTLGFREETIAKVRIIEIGGQRDFKKYWTEALNQNPVHIFFVIDVTSKTDFNDFNIFVKENQKRFPEILEHTILIVNKMDLVSALPPYILKNNQIIECSAKTGEGLLDLLELIANFKDVAEAKILINHSEREDKISENEDKEIAKAILKKYEGKF